jgi:GT2 family glycosyltransferase
MAPPLFSILLPADDDVRTTLRALQAIARLPEGRPFEVLIDVPADDLDTRVLVDGLEGDVRALITPSPTGYGAAFDRLAAAAHTDTLVLLSAAAVPADGWSEALLGALAEAGAGAALPRSLSADGAELPDAHWLALAVRSAPRAARRRPRWSRRWATTPWPPRRPRSSCSPRTA